MFQDRRDAGKQLAALLLDHRGAPDVVVVGLPRGGVPVAYEVATALDAPLDVIVVRKLGTPLQPELAMGAIGEGGVRYVDEELIERVHVTPHEVAVVEERERAALEELASHFRSARPRVPFAGRTVIAVDDGVASGSTARAACQVARTAGASRVILAVPVAPSDWEHRLRDVADEYVAVETHWRFSSVGLLYHDFGQVDDDAVVEYLDAVAASHAGESSGGTT